MRAAYAIELLVVLFLVSAAGNAPAAGVDFSPRKDKPADTGQPVPPDPNKTKQGGDNITTATVIPDVPYSISGTTVGYTDDYDEVCPYTGSTAPDVVYAYTAAYQHWIDISLCNSSYDTKLYVYENTVGNLVGCNDDACGDDGYKSQVTFLEVLQGNTYYIVVDGYGTSSGEYVLDLMYPPDPPICAYPSIFSSLPRLPNESWAASVSDVDYTDNELLVYESFGDLLDPIAGMSFWGLGAYLATDWSECFEDPTDLLITFYQDDEGAPGTEVASFPVAVTPVPSPFVYAGFTLNRYDVTLPSAVTLTHGWVSIQGTENPDCWFLWMNSTDFYDNLHYEWDGTTLVADSVDYSLCLLGPGGTPTGACCDSVGSCTILSEVECDATGSYYRGDGAVCNPNPCGEIGACCIVAGDCSQVTQGHCEATGREFQGAGVSCDPDPCAAKCCIGTVGNIQLVPDCDPSDQTVDITDLTNLIKHSFVTFEPFCCDEEADIAPLISGGVPDGTVDVGDLTALIDHLFINFPLMPPCL